MSQDDATQVKVLFPFESGAESMWADDLGGGLYRLDNVPLFAYDISYRDEFRAVPLEDGRLTFNRVVRRTGDRLTGLPSMRGMRTMEKRKPSYEMQPRRRDSCRRMVRSITL